MKFAGGCGTQRLLYNVQLMVSNISGRMATDCFSEKPSLSSLTGMKPGGREQELPSDPKSSPRRQGIL